MTGTVSFWKWAAVVAALLVAVLIYGFTRDARHTLPWGEFFAWVCPLGALLLWLLSERNPLRWLIVALIWLEAVVTALAASAGVFWRNMRLVLRPIHSDIRRALGEGK